MSPMAFALQSPVGPARHADGAIDRLAAAIAESMEVAPQAMRPAIVAALRRAVADPDLLAPPHRAPCAEDYARHLVHSDPAGRFAIVAIVWGPGQFSAPHAHHTWCAYAVYAGPVEETLYAWDPAAMRARPIHTASRPTGYACFSEAGLDQIHRVGNPGAEAAISLHVYGVDGARVATAVNRAVAVA